MAEKKVEPYQDVKDDAEKLTKARLKAAEESTVNDGLEITPIMQAASPDDAHDKKQNTGGVEVKGSPEKPSEPKEDTSAKATKVAGK
jgi:hypothetical protein